MAVIARRTLRTSGSWWASASQAPAYTSYLRCNICPPPFGIHRHIATGAPVRYMGLLGWEHFHPHHYLLLNGINKPSTLHIVSCHKKIVNKTHKSDLKPLVMQLRVSIMLVLIFTSHPCHGLPILFPCLLEIRTATWFCADNSGQLLTGTACWVELIWTV